METQEVKTLLDKRGNALAYMFTIFISSLVSFALVGIMTVRVFTSRIPVERGLIGGCILLPILLYLMRESKKTDTYIRKTSKKIGDII